MHFFCKHQIFIVVVILITVIIILEVVVCLIAHRRWLWWCGHTDLLWLCRVAHTQLFFWPAQGQERSPLDTNGGGDCSGTMWPLSKHPPNFCSSVGKKAKVSIGNGEAAAQSGAVFLCVVPPSASPSPPQPRRSESFLRAPARDQQLIIVFCTYVMQMSLYGNWHNN